MFVVRLGQVIAHINWSLFWGAKLHVAQFLTYLSFFVKLKIDHVSTLVTESDTTATCEKVTEYETFRFDETTASQAKWQHNRHEEASITDLSNNDKTRGPWAQARTSKEKQWAIRDKWGASEESHPRFQCPRDARTRQSLAKIYKKCGTSTSSFCSFEVWAIDIWQEKQSDATRKSCTQT